MIAIIGLKVVIVCKPMGRETGLAKCLNLFLLTFFFHVVVFFHWLLLGDKKAIPEDGWVFTVARKQPVYKQISPRHLGRVVQS